MASPTATSGAVIEATGQKLVRRFTDDLNGNTQLERSLKDAQAEQDRIEKAAFETRLRRYYEDAPESFSSADFNAAEVARQALNEICMKMESKTEYSKLGRFSKLWRRPKKSPKAEAAALMKEEMTSDFDQLRTLLESQEVKWKSTQGKVHRNFTKLCQCLDAHKKVFEVFPQQNLYSGAFCGSIALITHATLNHESVAETLSKAVADVAIDASHCTSILDLVRTKAMRQQLARVYEQVFEFYRDAIEWFSSSKLTKFSRSFNNTIKERFEEAAKSIHRNMEYMYLGCNLANAARVREMHSIALTQDEVFRQRQNPVSTNINVGQLAHLFLKGFHHALVTGDIDETKAITLFTDAVTVDDRAVPKGLFTREDLRRSAKNLEEFIVGEEGHSLFDDADFWLPDPDVSSDLGSWMAEEMSRTLWIASPITGNSITGARAAATNAVLALWRANAAVISHFCERPRACEDLTVEETGMIGLVYSLIHQLLQFKVEDDNLHIDEDALQRLDGTKESFTEAMEILNKLLRETPAVAFVVIDQVNDLEWGGGSGWCYSFLDVLFQHQAEKEGHFSILMTTSGSSKVLQEYVDVDDRCIAEQAARRVLEID